MIEPTTCPVCGAKLDLTTLESGDDYNIHEHLQCSVETDHPYYCITQKHWVGKSKKLIKV